ncbi:hypothetical protein, partial [Burkholderia thailandensis]
MGGRNGGGHRLSPESLVWAGVRVSAAHGANLARAAPVGVDGNKAGAGSRHVRRRLARLVLVAGGPLRQVACVSCAAATIGSSANASVCGAAGAAAAAGIGAADAGATGADGTALGAGVDAKA